MDLIQKLMGHLKALGEQLGKSPEDQDKKAIAKCLADITALAGSDEAKALGATAEMIKTVASIKSQLDAQAEQIRKIERVGLKVNGGSIVAPAGKAARLEMLADGRAFVSDTDAVRFACYVSMLRLGPACPADVREIGLAVCKDAGLDPSASATGGYLIPNEFRPEMIRNVEVLGVVFPLMRRIPLITVGQTLIPKRLTGLTAYPVAAAAEILRSSPTVGQIVMQPAKWATMTGIPNEFLQSVTSAAVAQWVATEIVYSLAYAMDNSVVNGDGTATYGGITGVLVSGNIGEVAAAAGHTTLATIDADDISGVIAEFPSAYGLPNAGWLMSLSVLGKLRSLKATTGESLYVRADGKTPSAIDGYPFTVSTRMRAKAACTAGVRYAIFGDLKLSHVFGMLGDVKVESSSDAGFTTDQTLVRGIAYFDCQEADTTAVVAATTHT